MMPLAELAVKAVAEGVKAADKVAETAEKAEKVASKISELGSKDGEAVRAKLEDILSMNPEQLEEYANKALEQVKQQQTEAAEKGQETKTEGTSDSDSEKQGAEGKEAKEGLTDEEKQKIKEETGWSDEIIDHIESMDQYEIYKNAGLHEEEINGRKCLVKDIDMDYVDPKTGMTNRERMERGLSPIDKETGEKIELHHMGQKHDGPFAELCENSEHGDGKHKTLHTSTEESWRNDMEKNREYQQEKKDHWKQRATQEG